MIPLRKGPADLLQVRGLRRFAQSLAVEADAHAAQGDGADPAPGTIVYAGALGQGFTDARLSAVFGLDLHVRHDDGRWSAVAR